MGMSTRAHIQSLSSIEPILVKIFEVVERWVLVEVWVHDSMSTSCDQLSGRTLNSAARRVATDCKKVSPKPMAGYYNEYWTEFLQIKT